MAKLVAQRWPDSGVSVTTFESASDESTPSSDSSPAQSVAEENREQNPESALPMPLDSEPPASEFSSFERSQADPDPEPEAPSVPHPVTEPDLTSVPPTEAYAGEQQVSEDTSLSNEAHGSTSNAPATTNANQRVPWWLKIFGSPR